LFVTASSHASRSTATFKAIYENHDLAEEIAPAAISVAAPGGGRV